MQAGGSRASLEDQMRRRALA
eukprot:COSAG01_NODE_19126_length_1029_cov_0.952688_1_plen_20_part_10